MFRSEILTVKDPDGVSSPYLGAPVQDAGRAAQICLSPGERHFVLLDLTQNFQMIPKVRYIVLLNGRDIGEVIGRTFTNSTLLGHVDPCPDEKMCNYFIEANTKKENIDAA